MIFETRFNTIHINVIICQKEFLIHNIYLEFKTFHSTTLLKQ